MIRCSKCKDTKSKTLFAPRIDKPRGYDSHCRPCRNKTSRNKPKTEPAMLGQKPCSKCGTVKKITEFFANRKHKKDGRDGQCKSCRMRARLHRLHTVPELRITENLRSRTRHALKGKSKSAATLELIGCSSKELRCYIESLFTKGMSWDNYGKWHIDHILPCNSFDLTLESEQRKCFNYKNLQPLWAKDNLRKGDRV